MISVSVLTTLSLIGIVVAVFYLKDELSHLRQRIDILSEPDKETQVDIAETYMDEAHAINALVDAQEELDMLSEIVSRQAESLETIKREIDRISKIIKKECNRD